MTKSNKSRGFQINGHSSEVTKEHCEKKKGGFGSAPNTHACLSRQIMRQTAVLIDSSYGLVERASNSQSLTVRSSF